MQTVQGGGLFVSDFSKTKEVIITAVDYATNFINYRARQIGTGGNFNFTFGIPKDFISLVSMELDCVPAITNPAANIDLASTYGNNGEPANQHIEINTLLTYPLVVNQHFTLNIATVFTQITANDRCGINVIHTALGGAIHYLFFRMVYR